MEESDVIEAKTKSEWFLQPAKKAMDVNKK
jgi:hypothetical protein